MIFFRPRPKYMGSAFVICISINIQNEIWWIQILMKLKCSTFKLEILPPIRSSRIVLWRISTGGLQERIIWSLVTVAIIAEANVYLVNILTPGLHLSFIVEIVNTKYTNYWLTYTDYLFTVFTMEMNANNTEETFALYFSVLELPWKSVSVKNC